MSLSGKPSNILLDAASAVTHTHTQRFGIHFCWHHVVSLGTCRNTRLRNTSVYLTCCQFEGQSKVRHCGVGKQVFSSHQDRQQLHAHAGAPDGEEIPCVVGLWTHTHIVILTVLCQNNTTKIIYYEKKKKKSTPNKKTIIIINLHKLLIKLQNSRKVVCVLV